MENNTISAIKDPKSELFIAVMFGSAQRARTIIETQPQALHDDYGAVLMGMAAQYALPDKIEILAAAQVSVNAVADLDHSPLWFAVSRGSEECVQVLLRLGADPNVLDPREGTAPLHQTLLILGRGHEIPRMLLQHGADPNQFDRLGRSPMSISAYMGDKQLIQAMLDHGGDPTLRSPETQLSAIDQARETHDEELAEYIHSIYQASKAMRAIAAAAQTHPSLKVLP